MESASRSDRTAEPNAQRCQLEHEIKQLIVETLHLRPAAAEAIAMDTPLFEDEVGLDSIDALQIVVAVERRYGARIQPDDMRNREILMSVQSLARYILTAGGHGR
jgi:acyl carrier protein